MRQIATSYITAHKEWHCPKKPCMACTTFLILFTDVWIFLTVRRGQQNERNDNRSGNPYQVLSSSYSMFMTLSFTTSPFSSSRDFLFASARTSSLLGTIMAPRRRWSYAENKRMNFITTKLTNLFPIVSKYNLVTTKVWEIILLSTSAIQ